MTPCTVAASKINGILGGPYTIIIILTRNLRDKTWGDHVINFIRRRSKQYIYSPGPFIQDVT